MDTGLLPGFRWQLGPVAITDTVVITWFLMLVIGVACWLLTRRMEEQPGMAQTAVEGVVTAISGAVKDVIPEYADMLTPFIGSLWIFLVAANLIGIVPGFQSPTHELSTTAALSILVFFSVHWYGIRTQGVWRYLKHYLEPSPLLLPFNLVGEVTRTMALMFRLFGNMTSLGLAAMLILLVAGFLAPVPILMLHIVEALVQAYIFGMLALIYIAGGIRAQKRKPEQRNSQ